MNQDGETITWAGEDCVNECWKAKREGADPQMEVGWSQAG